VNFGTGVVQDATLFIDSVNLVLKWQQKLQFIRSKYICHYLVKSAKSRQIKAFG